MAAFPLIRMFNNGTSKPNSIGFPPTGDRVGACPVPEWLMGFYLTVNGTMTCTVQITGDPAPSATGNWNNHDELQNLTVSANSNQAYPISGYRLIVTNWVSGIAQLSAVTWP